jgi:hypothetical protein
MSGNMRGTMPWMAPELFPVVTGMREGGSKVTHPLTHLLTKQQAPCNPHRKKEECRQQYRAGAED